MCDLCHSTPCLQNCPNNLDEPIYTCFFCGMGIYEGEQFTELNGVAYCKNCIEENTHEAEQPYDTEDWMDEYKRFRESKEDQEDV